MAIGPAGHELSFYDEISVEELMEFPFIPPEEIGASISMIRKWIFDWDNSKKLHV